MKKLLSLVIPSLLVVACGAPVKVGGGKQGAAQALLAASKPTAASGALSGSGVDITASKSWSCPEGGRALLSNFQLSVNPGQQGASVAQRFTLVFEGCGLASSDAGTAVYTGTLDVTQRVQASAADAVVEQTFKGRVRIEGAFDDFLEADVSQKVAASALGASGGTVSMELHGFLATSSGRYEYNESLDVSGGRLSVEAVTR